MANPTQPPSLPDDPLHYVAAADEYAPVLQLEDELEDGDEDGDASSGDGDSQGFKDQKKYKVDLGSILEFADDDELSEEENTLTKLNKLGFAPMSFLVSGASAFASENDLSRKVFMAEIGLINREIAPRDIADPKLFQKMDAKQTERRALLGIKTLDEIVTGAIGAAGMLVGVVASSVADFVKDKREERRVERQIRDYETGAEDYALDSEDSLEARSSMEAADFPVQDDQGEELADRMRLLQDTLDSSSVASTLHQPLNSYADIIEAEENQKRQTQAFTDPTGEVDLAGMFNVLATVTVAEQVQKVKLSDDIAIGGQDPRRAMLTQFDPMGGK